MINLNVVFYLLVIIAIVFLWFILSFLFKPIGKYIAELFKEAKENLKED